MEAKGGRVTGWVEIFGELPGDNHLYSEFKWEVITLASKQSVILLKG